MPAKRSTPKLIEDLHREMVEYSERKTPAEMPTGKAIAHEIKTRKAVPTIAGQTPSQTGIPLKIASYGETFPKSNSKFKVLKPRQTRKHRKTAKITIVSRDDT
jgi:hypothetical protein